MTTGHCRIPPRPSLDAHQAMQQMQDALQHLTLTPGLRAADWSIDVRLYQHREQEPRRPTGHGSPVTAACACTNPTATGWCGCTRPPHGA